jgi:ATP/ADP translocase
MNKELLTTILALSIAFVWSVVAISSVVTKEYNALAIITPVMLIVAGFLFGYKKNGN